MLHCARSAAGIDFDERGESTYEEMDQPGIHPQCHAAGRRLQKESCAASATAPTRTLRGDGFPVRESEYRRQGSSHQLTWQTGNATDVSIDGIGPVETSGSRNTRHSTTIAWSRKAQAARRTPLPA